MISSQILFWSYHTLYLKGTQQRYTLYIAPSKCFVLEVRAGIWRLAGKNWKVLGAGKYFSTVYSERR